MGNCEERIMKIRILLLLAALAWAGGAAAVPASAKAGDSWTYEARDGFNHELKTSYRVEVTEVSGMSIGTRVTDLGTQTARDERFTLNWNPLSSEWDTFRRYDFEPAYPEFPERIEPGVNWQEMVMSRDPATLQQMKMRIIGKVLGRERIRVPAGEFDCIKIGRDTILDDAQFWRGPTKVWDTEWYSPELNRWVRYETRSQYREEGGRNSLRRGDWTIFELTSFKAN
jgi:hypothetical protein